MCDLWFECVRVRARKKQDFETGSLLYIKQTNEPQNNEREKTHQASLTLCELKTNESYSNTHSSCVACFGIISVRACGTHKSIFISIERNQLAPRHD